MMPPHLRPVLMELEARVSRRFAGRRCEVRLFGSHARGEAHETRTSTSWCSSTATARFKARPGRGFVTEVERDDERP